jgi:carboxypeptidase Q
MEARFEDDANAANVIGEIRGREHPDEIMVVGCHLDSWDVGTGASDDAVGCVSVWEAVRLMKQLDLRPRRTVRAVLYANEENGLRGGLAYRDAHRETLERHVAMLEMDLGAFAPVHFGFSGTDAARATIEAIASLVEPVDAHRVRAGGGGADIGPSVQAAGLPALSLTGDAERYFMIHHTPADTVDRIRPDEVSRAVAAIAVMAYVVADLPERLDRAALSAQ